MRVVEETFIETCIPSPAADEGSVLCPLLLNSVLIINHQNIRSNNSLASMQLL